VASQQILGEIVSFVQQIYDDRKARTDEIQARWGIRFEAGQGKLESAPNRA